MLAFDPSGPTIMYTVYVKSICKMMERDRLFITALLVIAVDFFVTNSLNCYML